MQHKQLVLGIGHEQFIIIYGQWGLHIWHDNLTFDGYTQPTLALRQQFYTYNLPIHTRHRWRELPVLQVCLYVLRGVSTVGHTCLNKHILFANCCAELTSTASKQKKWLSIYQISRHMCLRYDTYYVSTHDRLTLPMSTDQSVKHTFCIFLRYVSSPLWRLGVAPVSLYNG